MTPSRAIRTLVIPPLLLLLTLGACADDPEVEAGDGGGSGSTATSQPDAPDGAPTTSGTISVVSPFVPVTEDCVDPADLDPDGAVSSDDPPICTDPDSTVAGSVLVEVVPGVQEGDKYSLTVDGDTVLLRRSGDTYARIAFSDLAEGQAADVWIDGPIAESYPMQATATAIVVTEGPTD